MPLSEYFNDHITKVMLKVIIVRIRDGFSDWKEKLITEKRSYKKLYGIKILSYIKFFKNITFYKN